MNKVSNANMPANPMVDSNGLPAWDSVLLAQTATGLSKLEYACIHCGVPETGDPDLDAIIAKGNEYKAAQKGYVKL